MDKTPKNRNPMPKKYKNEKYLKYLMVQKNQNIRKNPKNDLEVPTSIRPFANTLY